ncbi:MAG: cupin domain-containing protein [Polaribacter sp.]|jgi:mannose-6-phosphate isomerase-like protein (cupin superfamily)|nr:cupin domain-containing protein [Polaribacter sp.]MBT5099172.1 cupin domain-containing protein [Polaribacter sp.]MBT7704435.1 cupin domain-containing protein [Polaribacter sp.]MBT7815309.1 cupin domain-containing protein [Polaribacter sp.]MDA9277435.1 cupin domain-containing protein [Polaribacter sp.]
MSVVNIQEKFNLFSDHWSPKKVGELNGQQILLAKLKGEFVYHTHEHEDEFFMVIKGCLVIEMQAKTVTLNEGEFYIVPKGVAHKPIAKEEVHILLFEPLSIKHTGEVIANITVETYEAI